MRLAAKTLLIALWLAGASFAADQAATRAALERLENDIPQIEIYRENGRIARIYGTPFSVGANPRACAESFRLDYALALGVEPQNLKPIEPASGRSFVQPLMYNRVTREYKFNLVTYTQILEDIPVFRADLRLLIRNVDDNPLVSAASALRDLGDLKLDPALLAVDEAQLAANLSDPEFPELSIINSTRKVIWAGVDEMQVEPKLAAEIVAANEEPATKRWLYIVDLASGEVLYKENRMIDVDINGNVAGKATVGSGAEHCEDVIIKPLANALVQVQGSNQAYSDGNGDFTIPHDGSDPVFVTSLLHGTWFRVYNWLGVDAELVQSVTPPGPALFLHNSANDEITRAQVNAYVQTDRIREFVLQYNPTYPQLQQNEFPIYVNRTDGYCPGNAWYDPGDVSINFCLSGSSYPNTAWSSVIHHEYGHHLVEVAGSGQGEYGEGTGDVMSILLSDESGLGFGFYGDCGTPLREADNTFQYPCSGEIHYCGQLMSGCVWSLRNELAAKYPATYLDTLANLAINAVLMHTGSSITPQITIDYLTLDDDDGDINNGTPNYDAICAAFDAHNMDCPAIQFLSFTYPDGKPEMVSPNQEASFRMVVNGQAGAPVSGTGEFYYSVDGAPFVVGMIEELSANEYQVTLPAVDCFSRVDWYVTAQTDDAQSITDPAGAPSVTYSALAASSSAVAVSDDFQSDLGWTVSNSGGLTDGSWQRAIPAGGGDRGDPATDFDGSGYCYVTDNADDNSDVDDGTTSLTSPTLDLSGGEARISYARWYSNNNGNAPFADVMEVFVSDNDGADWVLAETVGPTEQAAGGWYESSFWLGDFVENTATVKVRFDASDLGDGSVVEAGVDDFEVTLFACEPSYTCGDADGNEIINISDAVFLISYIFAGGLAPNPMEAGDLECNGIVNISDAVFLISYIFGGGPAPCSECS